MPDLSIVIVSWNVRDLLRGCLRSICATPEGQNAQVIVVDNVSTDGSAEMVEAEFPAVQVVRSAENRGFAAANNVGLALATGGYVLLLNPDTEIVGTALSALMASAEAQPDVAVVGPQLLNSDGTLQRSRYRFPTFATALFESTWLQPIAPRRLLRRYYVLDLPDDQPCDVDWVRGAALLARRAAIDDVGLLDEAYFMYSEELDWCRRFRDAGWRVIYLPQAQVVHHGGKSSEQVLAARHIHFGTSKVRYFRKHHGLLAAEALRWFLLGTYTYQIAVEGLKWLLGHKRELRKSRLKAYGQVLRSRLS